MMHLVNSKAFTVTCTSVQAFRRLYPVLVH